MNRSLAIARLAASLTLLVAAIPTSTAQGSLDGSWEASWETPGGRMQVADVVVTGSTGTWKTLATAKNNPCIGVAYPFAVQPLPEGGGVRLKIDGAAGLAGCPDFSVSLKPRDEKTLEGTRGNQPVVLKRK